MSASTPKKDKGKATQQQLQPSLINKHIPLEPLLFYLRDHELFYTAFKGPRYNEDTIFIDYHEWYLSANIPFYQYLKIIKAYRSLLQIVNNHPVQIVLPTGYVETCRFFHLFTYWKPYDTYVLHFVQKVIPDVHICLHDFLSYHTHFFTTTSQVQLLIPHTCLQLIHLDKNCTGHQLTHYDIHCKFLWTAAQRRQELDSWQNTKS